MHLHHELCNRYTVSGRLILDSPLRLSSGVASVETDAPLMRTHDGRELIPGTSLRGVLRSALERILTTVGATLPTPMSACALFTDDDCGARLEAKRRAQARAGLEDLDESAILAFIADEACDVCRLFGNTMLASRLVVEDCLRVGSGGGNRIRDSVGIHRDEGAAAHGAKFDFEVLEPSGGSGHAAFTFALRVENLGPRDKDLVGVMLGLLRQGMHVGGKQAAGLGLVRLDASAITVRGFTLDAQAFATLARGEDPARDFADWNEVSPC